MNGIVALLAAGACAALGMAAARRLAMRERALNAWEGALMRMEGAVSHSGDGLRDVLKKGAGEDNAVLRQLIDRMEAAPAAPSEALIRELNWESVLSDAEKETLAACLLSLFSPSLAQQAQAIAYAREQWAVFRLKGREARERDGKLYISLGWLAGAAVFILLC